ncbi:metal-binding protein [Bordetella flabilis]|uniref:Metal-binding protein n=2 Tax=Bordetella flabilis TaxID=463014 RepID=A0A193GEW0_9BORD|nr:metal-binding protein [Bordetella flabilis]
MQPISETHRQMRRALLVALAGAPVWAVAGSGAQISVWKTPTCGCCKDWVKHLKDSGFEVAVHDVPDTSAVRQRNGIPNDYASCHSARIDGYALEGHVPATEIRRLLRERPEAVGLAVPGMPLGAPGMDGPDYGGRRLPYNVYLIERAGRARVYQAYV